MLSSCGLKLEYVAECSDYPKLAKISGPVQSLIGPVQSLIVDQFKIPRKGDMAEIACLAQYHSADEAPLGL